jgi:DNA polymerase III sliding clamp (beta) subunit (PCNA family)
MTTKELRKALIKCLKFTGKSEARPEINNVRFNANKSAFDIVATDSYRLTLFNFKGKLEKSFSLDKERVGKLKKLLIGKKGDVKIKVDKKVHFIIENKDYNTELCKDDNYPNYKAIIPEYKEAKKINTMQLKNQVKIAKTMADEKTKSVTLENNLIRTKVDGDESETKINWTLPSIDVNWNYLLSIISDLKSAFFSMDDLKNGMPLMVRDNNNLNLLMPLKR